VSPESPQKIARALERAAARGQRVRVAGSGRSFSDVTLTDRLQLRLHRFL
jgi:FAD/FMN-containing dehydrogenase